MALAGFEAPVIETVTAKVRSGELELSLRLQPPSGSAARQRLDGVLKGLRTQARDAGKRGGRPLWRRYFLIRDAFASLGPAAVLTVHRSQGSSFGEVFVADDVFLAAGPCSATAVGLRRRQSGARGCLDGGKVVISRSGGTLVAGAEE